MNFSEVKAHAWPVSRDGNITTVCTIDIEGQQTVKFTLPFAVNYDEMKVRLHLLGRFIAEQMEPVGERKGSNDDIMAGLMELFGKRGAA